eukprot:364477-Chlamydomonas_euryale.AAC.3
MQSDNIESVVVIFQTGPGAVGGLRDKMPHVEARRYKALNALNAVRAATLLVHHKVQLLMSTYLKARCVVQGLGRARHGPCTLLCEQKCECWLCFPHPEWGIHMLKNTVLYLVAVWMLIVLSTPCTGHTCIQGRHSCLIAVCMFVSRGCIHRVCCALHNLHRAYTDLRATFTPTRDVDFEYAVHTPERNIRLSKGNIQT